MGRRSTAYQACAAVALSCLGILAGCSSTTMFAGAAVDSSVARTEVAGSVQFDLPAHEGTTVETNLPGSTVPVPVPTTTEPDHRDQARWFSRVDPPFPTTSSKATAWR